MRVGLSGHPNYSLIVLNDVFLGSWVKESLTAAMLAKHALVVEMVQAVEPRLLEVSHTPHGAQCSGPPYQAQPPPPNVFGAHSCMRCTRHLQLDPSPSLCVVQPS